VKKPANPRGLLYFLGVGGGAVSKTGDRLVPSFSGLSEIIKSRLEIVSLKFVRPYMALCLSKRIIDTRT